MEAQCAEQVNTTQHLELFFGACIYWSNLGSWPWLEIHQAWLVKLAWAVPELPKHWAMNWLASWWCPKSWSTARWTNLFIHPWGSLGLALVMAFAMALVMVFAMALASSAVTWCNHLGQKMW